MNEALIRNKERAAGILTRRWGNPDDFKGPVVFLAGPTSLYISEGDSYPWMEGQMAR
jgi:2-deoxy-D-gluconate 3-dehydrogenase